MKLTVELDDALHREAMAFAREHGTTLRQLVESGLRRQLKKREDELGRVLTRSTLNSVGQVEP